MNILLLVLLLVSSASCISVPIKVGFIGDSITVGVCASSPVSSYTAQLQSLLGGNYIVSNFGNSGKTLLKKTRSPYWNTQSWRLARNDVDDVYVIMLGTNDAKTEYWYPCIGPDGVSECSWISGDNFIADLVEMIARLRDQSGAASVFVVAPPRLFLAPEGTLNQTVINVVLPALLPQIAAANDARYVAFTNALASFNDTCDGIHPNDSGYAKIAAVMHRQLLALSQTLGWDETHPYVRATNERILAAGTAQGSGTRRTPTWHVLSAAVGLLLFA